MISVWRSSGYSVELAFLSLPDVEMAIERVAMRVKQGGHNVPEDVIRRRFAHGIGTNLQANRVGLGFLIFADGLILQIGQNRWRW